MRPRFPRRDLGEVLLLAGVVALIAARSGDVRQLEAVARESRPAFQSDEDFYRAQPVLGFEYPILRRLLRDYPAGTRVSLPPGPRALARRQRFWLSLLPRYPIATGANLVVCAAPCAAPGDEELERGREFVLLARKGGTPAPAGP